MAKLGGEGADLGGVRSAVIEEEFELAGDPGSLVVAVHAKGASELVGGVSGFFAKIFKEGAGGGAGGGAIEHAEALLDERAVAEPEGCQQGRSLFLNELLIHRLRQKEYREIRK